MFPSGPSREVERKSEVTETARLNRRLKALRGRKESIQDRIDSWKGRKDRVAQEIRDAQEAIRALGGRVARNRMCSTQVNF